MPTKAERVQTHHNTAEEQFQNEQCKPHNYKRYKYIQRISVSSVKAQF